MNWPGIPLRARMRLPRFRAKNFSTCTRSPTARGSSHASHSPWDDVAFSSTERDRHLGIRPVSQLNTWPVVSPVNASRRPSRDAVHHSGSGRLARPSPWGTFTSYSLPASWRTPFRVNRDGLTLDLPRLVLPEERTSSDCLGTSQRCHKQKVLASHSEYYARLSDHRETKALIELSSRIVLEDSKHNLLPR